MKRLSRYYVWTRAVAVTALIIASAVAALLAAGRDAVAETRPNDDYFRWGYQWNLEKIRAPSAWDITRGSSDVVIAVVSTGVEMDHPDLAAKLVPGTNTVTGGSTDDDYWGSFGTATGGIAAAITGNTIGVAGICWDCKIMPVRVCEPVTCPCASSPPSTTQRTVILRGTVFGGRSGRPQVLSCYKPG